MNDQFQKDSLKSLKSDILEKDMAVENIQNSQEEQDDLDEYWKERTAKLIEKYKRQIDIVKLDQEETLVAQELEVGKSKTDLISLLDDLDQNEAMSRKDIYGKAEVYKLCYQLKYKYICI